MQIEKEEKQDKLIIYDFAEQNKINHFFTLIVFIIIIVVC